MNDKAIIVTDEDKFEARSPGVPVVQDEPSFNSVLMKMVENKMTPEVIEKMMDLRERDRDYQREQEAEQAKRAYVTAMAAFKKNDLKIYKTKKAGFDHKTGGGRTEYGFAPLPKIQEVIDPLLSEQGLNYTFDTDQDEKEIIVSCIMEHDWGHSAKRTLRAPRDDSGKKNFIQSMGSTISYLERYTLLAVTGLATHDIDDDGQAAGKEPEYITEGQQKTITKRLTKIYGKDPSMFFDWMQCETVDTITDFDKAMKGLDGAEAQLTKSKREPGSDDK